MTGVVGGCWANVLANLSPHTSQRPGLAPHSRIQERQHLTNQPLQLTELVPASDP